MITAKELWKSYANSIFKSRVSDVQFAETRLAFYSGMASMTRAISLIADNSDDEDEACQQYSDFEEEITAFFVDPIHAINEIPMQWKMTTVTPEHSRSIFARKDILTDTLYILKDLRRLGLGFQANLILDRARRGFEEKLIEVNKELESNDAE